MMLLLFLLALSMMVTGAASAFFGIPIYNVERGIAMILGGTTVASAGAVLFGLTFVCYRLKKIQREIRRLGDRLIRHADATRPVVGEPAPLTEAGEFTSLAGNETTDAELIVEPVPPPSSAFLDASPVDEKPKKPERVVVGKYASGGNSYVMYSDGSIAADTPSGHHHFNSLDELKAFVAAGGERR